MQVNIKVKKLPTLKLIKKCNKKRGLKASFFFLIFFLVVSSNSKAQSTMSFHKDSIRNFLFVGTSGQVVPKMKQRLNPSENFVILEGNRATIQVVSMMNQDMGRNGIGGVTHTGPITQLEIFKKTDLIEVSFLVGSATTKISVFLKLWDDGEASVNIEPLNTNISLILRGDVHKIDRNLVNEGANK
jgi:hypothetical protein